MVELKFRECIFRKLLEYFLFYIGICVLEYFIVRIIWGMLYWVKLDVFEKIFKGFL